MLPVAAIAEGSWSSSLSNVRSGYASRLWYDNYNDNQATTNTLSGCSRSDGATFLLNVDLRRQRGGLPDASYGKKNVSTCASYAITANWGRMTSKGNYFFQYWHYNYGTVSARSVSATY
jgi:hypothetical protein